MSFKTTGFVGVSAWIFYRSVWVIPFLLPIWIWYYKGLCRECIRRKQQEFLIQFKEMIQAISAALHTGYSVENAIRASYEELRVLYSEDTLLMQELKLLVRQLRIQIPVEQAIEDMAQKTELEDVESFAAVFAAAKRSGGDMIAIIRNTSGQIADKIDVKREIGTLLAAKKYEFKVMTIVPYMMIAYMTLSFPEFLSCLYGNILGTGVMTICFAVYLTAYYLGIRIIEIEV